jgi:hypothetical protein
VPLTVGETVGEDVDDVAEVNGVVAEVEEDSAVNSN